MKIKEWLKNIFLDKGLLFTSLALVLIYPLLYIMQFHTMINLNAFLLLIPTSYVLCLILSIPFRLLMK